MGSTIFSGNTIKLLKPALAIPASTSGLLTIQPAATTTSHTITMPAANAAGALTNDGAGIMSYQGISGVTAGAVSINLLQSSNYDFEAATATPPTGWTTSGAFTVETTAANVGYGAKSGKLITTAQNQYALSTSIAVPPGLFGRNGCAQILTKTSAASGDYVLEVFDGSAVLVSQSIPTGGFTVNTVNFIFPSSGSLSVRVRQSATGDHTSTPIWVDNAYLGDAFNIQNISQAQLVGTVKVTGCAANWSSTSASLAAFSAASSCVYTTTGDAVAPSTNVPGIKFNSLSPGEYRIQAEGTIGITQAGACASDFQFTDGTNTTRELSHIGAANGVNPTLPGIDHTIAYTTAQGATTLQMFTKASANCTSVVYGTTSNPLVIKVYRFPTTSQTYAFGDPTFTDWQSYTPTIGATSVAPTEGTGVTKSAKWKRVGDTMEIMFNYVQTGAGSAGTGTYLFPLPTGYTIDTTKLAVSTSGNQSVVGKAQAYNGNSGDVVAYNSTNLAIFLNYATGGSSQQFVSSTFSQLSNAAEYYSFFARVPISGWTSTIPTVAMVGGVSSSSAGQVLMNYAQVTVSNSVAAVVSQSGSWLSVANGGGAGLTTGTMTGFTGVPACSCTVIGAASTSASWCGFTAEPTSTNLSITRTRAGAAENGDVNIICIGPK